MDDGLPSWFWPVFPVLWLGMWLAITQLIALFSGWFALQARFPDSHEPAEITLRMQSGSVGLASMSGILTLSATRTGLRVGIWRIFGPLQRPFLVPWNRIKAEPRKMLFASYVRLRLGDPHEGSLTITARSWEKLSAYSDDRRLVSAVPPVIRQRNASEVVLQWLAVTTLAACFFYFAPRVGGHFGPPLIVCIAFPGIVFGVGQLIRYLREG